MSALIHWHEDGDDRSAVWRSESGIAPPPRVMIADDTLSADAAYRAACEGTALLWRGDFHNAKQLLQALGRRVDRKPRKQGTSPAEDFHLYRLTQSQRARILGMLLLPFEAGHTLALRRAPDVSEACTQAWGAAAEPYVASLRELLGAIGAYEWRKKGIDIPLLDARIHPHYGVFAPIRSEYLGLVNQAPMPAAARARSLAWDIGTGTGVLAAVLALRNVERIVATDQDARAIACAQENMARLGLADQVDILQTDLFPEGKAPLIVCNPPWLPARASSPLEHAVYDPDGRMLRGFLQGLPSHLEKGGEGWLILSDLAEHLGLRTHEALLAQIESAGLKVLGRIDARPVHPRASDADDPLHAARAKEKTSLWRLAAA